MTKAAKFPDQLSEDVKSARLNRLLARHREIATELAHKYTGRVVDVLVEKFNLEKGELQGRSSQNKTVFFKGDASMIGRTLKVRVNESLPFIARGEALV